MSDLKRYFDLGDLVIFTIPKAFTEEHIAMIQHNAIHSWKELPCRKTIVLCCDDEGVKEAAIEHGCIHADDIKRSVEGVPYVSDAFARVQEAYPDRILLYVNSDILLPISLIDAARASLVRCPHGFLLVGDRWDWHTPRDLTDDDWDEAAVWEEALADGHMDPPVCADYFIFPSGQYTGPNKMPDFAIGYYAWDTWLSAYTSVTMDLPVIDLSPSLTVIHQDHRHHRHPRNAPRSLKNIALLDKKLLVAGGRNDRMPYMMTKEGDIVKRALD